MSGHDPRHPDVSYEPNELVRLGDVIDALHLADGEGFARLEHPAAVILRVVAGLRRPGYAIVRRSDARLTLREYLLSTEMGRRIDADDDFYAILSLLMRNADTYNADRLRAAYPLVWDDLKARYNAPGGVLPDDDPSPGEEAR